MEEKTLSPFLPPKEHFRKSLQKLQATKKQIQSFKKKGLFLGFKEAQELLQEEDFVLLSKWIKLLGASHKKIYFSLLLPFQDHWHFEVRAAVANAIGLMRDQRGMEVLISLLKDKSQVVKWEAKIALINLEVKEALPFYLDCLLDPYPGIRLMSAQAVEALMDEKNSIPLQNAYKGAEKSVKVGIMGAMTKNNFPSLHTIEEALVRDIQPEVKASGILHLSRYPKESYLQLFAPFLKSKELILRLASIQGISNLGYRMGVKLLLPFIQDQNFMIRASVVRSLGSIGGFEHLEYLLFCLKDQHSRVRTEAANALGKLKYPESIPALTKLTQDSNPNVRSAVAFALYSMDERGTVNPKILQETINLHLHNLDSGDIYERREALKNLVVYQDLAFATDRIAETLEDHDMEIRRLAIRALALNESPKLKKQLAKVFKDKEIMVRWELAYNFSESHHSNFDQDFLLFLEDSEPSIRIKAAQYFASKETCENIGLVAKKINDKDPIVRWYILYTLFQSQDAQILPYLKTLIQDSNFDFSFWAIIKLGEMENEEALPFLLQNLHHKEAWVRKEVARVLTFFPLQPSFSSRLFPSLKDPEKKVRNSISFLLRKDLPEKEVKFLLPYLEGNQDEITFQHLAPLVIASKSTEVRNTVQGWLKNPKFANRDALLEAIFSKPKSQENLNYFLILLEDSDPKIRMQSTKILGSLRMHSVWQAIAERVEKEKNAEEILTLLKILSESAFEGGKGVLQKFVEHPQQAISNFAKNALTKKKRGPFFRFPSG